MSRGNEKRKTRAWKREIRNKSTRNLLFLLKHLGVKCAIKPGQIGHFSIRGFVDKHEHLPVRPGPGWY